jgi:hypothetical protein
MNSVFVIGYDTNILYVCATREIAIQNLKEEIMLDNPELLPELMEQIDDSRILVGDFYWLEKATYIE